MATTDNRISVNDAVLTPDGVMHAVAADHEASGFELACGLLVRDPALATDLEGVTPCVDCANGTTAPADTEPEQAEDPAAEQEPEAEAEVAATTRVANQPTKAAMESKTVGVFTLEQPKKDGAWRLRSTLTQGTSTAGKLEPEGFELYEDAAWFAQRRTRLMTDRGGFEHFGGTRKRIKVKVPATVGAYTIAGEAGKTTVLDAKGQQVGPTFRHKANSRVDAYRWAQRLQRPGRAALNGSSDEE